MGDCIIFTGSKDNNNFGNVKIKNKVIKAHRLAYSIVHGQIESSITVHHTCKNRLCVNIDHLFIDSIEHTKKKFMANVKKTDTCWIWTGYRNESNYGTFRFDKKTMKKAHRAAYELFVGPIPENLLICHKCDNPPCVNPKHLFVGTYSDNMRDCAEKGRHKGKLRITRVQAQEIRKRYRPYTDSVRLLADEYGVKRRTIYGVLGFKRKIDHC